MGAQFVAVADNRPLSTATIEQLCARHASRRNESARARSRRFYSRSPFRRSRKDVSKVLELTREKSTSKTVRKLKERSLKNWKEWHVGMISFNMGDRARFPRQASRIERIKRGRVNKVTKDRWTNSKKSRVFVRFHRDGSKSRFAEKRWSILIAFPSHCRRFLRCERWFALRTLALPKFLNIVDETANEFSLLSVENL